MHAMLRFESYAIYRAIQVVVVVSSSSKMQVSEQKIRALVGRGREGERPHFSLGKRCIINVSCTLMQF